MKININIELLKKAAIIFLIFVALDGIGIYMSYGDYPSLRSFSFKRDFNAFVFGYIFLIIPLSMWVKEKENIGSEL